MYRVLVVDDEPAALQHVCTIVKKRCPEYEVAGTAENGREALEMVEILKPDLLICDVKMPLMDGISLVSKVKEQYPGIFSVIVSGYSDFAYAKGALQSEVCDYILKPVVPSDMKKTLDAIGGKIRKNHYQRRNTIIRAISTGAACDPEEMARYFCHEAYNCAIIRRNGLPRRFYSGGNTEIFSDINETFAIYGRDEMEALYMIPTEMLLGEPFEKYLLKILEGMDTWEGYTTTVYQEKGFPPERLQETVRGLYSLLDAVSVVGQSQMVEAGAYMEPSVLWTDNDAVQAVPGSLERMLKEQRYDRLKKELRRLYAQWLEERKPQLWMEHVSRQILNLIRKYDRNALPLLECESMMEDAFFYAESGEKLIDNLLDIMFKYITAESTVSAKIDSPEFVRSITDYMESHIAENLSLQNIARVFAVSETYLGKLFRKYRNQSYNQYLTVLRMEKATKLMKENPSLFIKDVAAMVGYGDQFYFSRIFRSCMGVCPSDYLESVAGNMEM